MLREKLICLLCCGVASMTAPCFGESLVLRDIPERPVVGEPSVAPVVHWEEIMEHDGERVHFHLVRADLDDSRCEVRVIYGEDPDGPEGPALTQLVNPVDLAASNHVLVAVNANAFKGLPDLPPMERARGWYLGKHIIPIGQVVVDGTPLPGIPQKRLMIWTDHDNRVHTGRTPDDLTTIQQGVSDWGGNLISNGVFVSKNRGANHRSMAGTDATGRWLFLLVADGAASGTRSSGASFSECADLLLEIGCTEAIALDGGGSVAMALARPLPNDDGSWREGPVVEASARTNLRPIPVAIALSKRRE